LSVWAHPDDESWSAAGIMMAARDHGQKVVCVTATRGEQGVQDEKRWPQEHLADIREQELQKTMEIMDISSHIWLDYADGGCAQIAADSAVAKLVAIITEVRPDSILTFGPDGITGHSDHITVGHWVGQAVAQSDPRPAVYHATISEEWYQKVGKQWDEQFDVFFNIDPPVTVPDAEVDLRFLLTKELLARKLAALRAQRSQTEVMFASMPLQELCDTAAQECFMRAR